ncbi:MAG: hypothetical protein ACO3JL_07865 [Myxococcota bacterium]
MAKLQLEDVNPEAGSHPVPSHEGTLIASLEAGRLACEQWTYLRERFGERGLRFSQSDGAWIAAVAQRPLPDVQKEMRWLRMTLSRRGMPHIIIQTFVEAYCRLMTNDTTADESLERLRGVAQEWTEARLGFMASSFGRKWGEAMSLLAAPLPNPRAQEAIALLAAALVDEQAGVRDAYREVAAWLGSAWWGDERFVDQLLDLRRSLGHQ